MLIPPTTISARWRVLALVAAVLTLGLLAAGCGGGDDEYMAEHPNVTVKETSVEQEGEYYQALQTRLAANSGLADVQGIEVGRIAEVIELQGDKWVDLNTLGADELEDTFFDWKWEAATTED